MKGKEKSWYIYFLLLLFLAPVGIILLWKDKKSTKPIRVALSIFFGLFFLSVVINQGSNESNKGKVNTAYTASAENIKTTQANNQLDTSSKEEVVKKGTLKTKKYTYKGYIKNGVPYKSGTFTFTNGDKLTGPITKGYISGKAKLEYADGDIYKGKVSKNIPNGAGIYTTKDGDIIEGTWKNGILTGKVTVTYVSGDIYEGDTVDKVKSGKGTMKFANGDIYVGDWANDTYNGTGIYTFNDTQSYDGEWKDGLLNGTVKYKDANGIIYTGKWENGTCVKINKKD
jgi:hypothetical protein